MPELYPYTQLRDIATKTLDLMSGESEGPQKYKTNGGIYGRSADGSTVYMTIDTGDRILSMEMDVDQPEELNSGYIFNEADKANRQVEPERTDALAAYMLQYLTRTRR